MKFKQILTASLPLTYIPRVHNRGKGRVSNTVCTVTVFFFSKSRARNALKLGYIMQTFSWTRQRCHDRSLWLPRTFLSRLASKGVSAPVHMEVDCPRLSFLAHTF